MAFLSVMLLALAKLCVMLSTSMARLFINQSTSKGMVARQVFRLREAVELGVGAVVEADNEQDHVIDLVVANKYSQAIIAIPAIAVRANF